MSRTRRPVLLVAVAALAGVIALTVAWGPLRRQLLLSVTQRPTPYAELYFSDFSALPAAVHPGTDYAVPYTLVSHEGRTEDLTVSAALSYDGRTLPVSTNTVRLRDGGRTAGTVRFDPPVPATVYRLVISLPGGQSISWRIAAP